MTLEEENIFLQERNESAKFAIQQACMVGAIAFFLFGLVDVFFIQGYLLCMSWVFRGVCIAVLLQAFAFIRNEKSKRNNILIAWLVFLFIGMSVNFVTYLVGGIHSGYHQALILTLIAYAGFIPSNLIFFGSLSFCLIVFYNVAVFSVEHMEIPLKLLVTNNTVLVISSLGALGIYLIQLYQLKKEFLTRGQLNNVNMQLKSASQSKDQFFANISHELRTPLTIIMASIESLTESTDYTIENKVADQLNLCYRNSIRLLRLVDDVLELSKIEKGIFRLTLIRMSMAEMLEGLVSQITPLANRKNISVVYDVSEKEGLFLVGDEWQLERVILNLFANAIKFTPDKGKITVSARKEKNGVLIKIEDTGAGISEQDLPFVFEPFFQGNHQGDRKPGVGIGLALCSKIVGAHNGRLSIESKLGLGTALTIWLPEELSLSPEEQERRHINVIVKEDNRQETGLHDWNNKIKKEQESYRLFPIQDAAERRIVPRTSKDMNLPLVLMVDDNKDVLILVKSILNDSYRIYTAESAKEGLDLAHRYKPDLIVSDLMMPEMNGLDFFNEIKKIPSLMLIPFVLLTAKGQVEDRILAGEVGVDGYLSKPFHPRELKATISRLLTNKIIQEEKALDERSSSMQVMAEGIAHDILNPVGFVQSSFTIIHSIAEQAVQLLPENNTDKNIFKEDLRKFYEAGTQGLLRIQEAIGQLRRFSKGNIRLEPILLDVNQAVNNAIAVISGSHHVLSTFNATLFVYFSPGELEQVVLNLLINAVQASAHDAVIEVCTDNVNIQDDHDPEKLIKGVGISIQDHGKGIASSLLSRVFDPYFTTKQMGTGLGLTVCRKIIKEHGGNLEILSSEGIGTKVKIWLPSIQVNQDVLVAN